MPWFKVDDKLHGHRKSARAGTHAMGLWVLAGSWCMDHLTDGFLPLSQARRLDPDAPQLAEQLVVADLWEPSQQDGEDGWQFRNWHEFQPTRESVEAERAAARERMARNRSKGSKDVRANSKGTTSEVQPPRTRSRTSKEVPPAEPGPFDTFWADYPRKEGKAAAAKAWTKALQSVGNDALVILDGLNNSLAVWKASGTEAKFIPHPTTWLNQGRWADEVPLPDMPTPGASVAVYDLPPLPEPPDHIRDAGGRAYAEWAQATRAEQIKAMAGAAR